MQVICDKCRGIICEADAEPPMLAELAIYEHGAVLTPPDGRYVCRKCYKPLTITQRIMEAREAKNYAEADRLREQLESRGFRVLIQKNGDVRLDHPLA